MSTTPFIELLYLRTVNLRGAHTYQAKPIGMVLKEKKTRSTEQTRAPRNNLTIIQKLDIRKGSKKIIGKRINSEIRNVGPYLTLDIK